MYTVDEVGISRIKNRCRMDNIEIFTIGFTGKPAKRFFELLKNSGAKRILDVRLNNVSQLAGFAKRDDLKYFAQEICDMEYLHILELAPTKKMLDDYKKKNGDWEVYEKQFLNLMKDRHIEASISKEKINKSCLLCSEDKPDQCHRRLVAEYLKIHWNEGVSIKHLF